MGSYIPQASELLPELKFKASRSGGPGGQNVNKVNSKVTLYFDVSTSSLLTLEQKEMILKKLGTRITNAGILMIVSQEKRSQLENKEQAIEKLNQLLAIAFAPKKKRTATKPGKAVKAKRLNEKKRRSEVKQWRRRSKDDKDE